MCIVSSTDPCIFQCAVVTGIIVVLFIVNYTTDGLIATG